MTDRELLEKAAKAAGWLEMRFDERGRLYVCVCQGDPKEWELWDPLKDDGEALRLAVKLRLRVEWWKNGIEVTHPDLPPSAIHSTEYDKCSAARRAIVEAAAAIGESL